MVGEYVQAKEVHERAAAEAQTASWKRFCSAQDGESLWDGIYRVIRGTGKNWEDFLLQIDSGRELGPPGEVKSDGQGDVRCESGGRDDHSHYCDRTYHAVRIVRLGTGDREARRAEDARRYPAHRRS
ncbi:hypothetical protein EVAR_41146_1 [Eumeta japonica]|uniref:Uncharacterized protein n=1 Tax=Eumeta variegata TaxID=151549 RepID=A0A4C1YD18_EUMVA|nr:hypothetical protein EVAR_41146_1 [Eumeta japonica]